MSATMPLEVVLNTPLAEALHAEILPKLAEIGWGSGDQNDKTLSEYIVLMLVNGKSQDSVASELAGDLLNLGPDDPDAGRFAKWLFEQVDILNVKINGHAGPSPGPVLGDAMAVSQDDSTAMADDQEMDATEGNDASGSDLNAPTGPKAMRNGVGPRGIREKRMIGQMNRAMDRTPESILHRIRGQSGTERVNMHGNRLPPSGPRMGGGLGVPVGRQARNNMGGRLASITHGLGGLQSGLPGPPLMGGGPNGPWPPLPGQPGQPPVDMYAMLEQQSRMMQQMQFQMHQQMMMHPPPHHPGPRGHHGSNGAAAFHNQPPLGRPLSDRIQHPGKPFRKAGPPLGGPGGPGDQQHQQHHQGLETATQPQAGAGPEAGGSGGLGDTDMAGIKVEALEPEETVCKFNLACTNKECKFAHQSPAAAPGVTIDVHDVCTFGAACKNRKCVGRHPSPAGKTSHQSEQDCKFFPNCANPRCPFRHPNMPLCRNGGDCAVPGCKFTHVKTQCKYHPCTNRFCTFKHDEGQRGIFQDKVWTADGGSPMKEHHHVSERRFVDETAPEENILLSSSSAGPPAPGDHHDQNMASEEPHVVIGVESRFAANGDKIGPDHGA